MWRLQFGSKAKAVKYLFPMNLSARLCLRGGWSFGAWHFKTIKSYDSFDSFKMAFFELNTFVATTPFLINGMMLDWMTKNQNYELFRSQINYTAKWPMSCYATAMWRQSPYAYMMIYHHFYDQLSNHMHMNQLRCYKKYTY